MDIKTRKIFVIIDLDWNVYAEAFVVVALTIISYIVTAARAFTNSLTTVISEEFHY